jgi:hypothetical protein
MEFYGTVEYALQEYKDRPTPIGLSLWLIMAHDYYREEAPAYLAEKSPEVEGLISPDELQKTFLEKKVELVERRKNPTIPPEFQGKKANQMPAVKIKT